MLNVKVLACGSVLGALMGCPPASCLTISISYVDAKEVVERVSQLALAEGFTLRCGPSSTDLLCGELGRTPNDPPLTISLRSSDKLNALQLAIDHRPYSRRYSRAQRGAILRIVEALLDEGYALQLECEAGDPLNRKIRDRMMRSNNALERARDG